MTTRFGPLMLLLVALAVALVPTAASADTYPAGYVNGDGYTWNNGYWWKHGAAYKHESYWVAGSTYYSYGHWYTSPGHWAYKYVSYPVATYVPPAAKVSHHDPDWRSKLLEIAGNRDKWEAENRKAAFEQRYFAESVQALGLAGNFRWEGYGTAPPYPAGGVAHAGANFGAAVPLNGLYSHSSAFTLGNYGATGSTVYGSSYKQLADLYGDTNLNQLYQSANRLAENSQKLAGQAAGDFSSLVKEEGGNKARVAQILARAEAVRAFLAGLDGPPATATETKTFEFKADGGASGPPTAGATTQSVTRKQEFEAVWKARCAACHTGSSARGKFTLDVYYAMKPDEKLKVWQLLVTKDKDRVMPRTKDGGPGELLPQAEVRLFTEF